MILESVLKDFHLLCFSKTRTKAIPEKRMIYVCCSLIVKLHVLCIASTSEACETFCEENLLLVTSSAIYSSIRSRHATLMSLLRIFELSFQKALRRNMKGKLQAFTQYRKLL